MTYIVWPADEGEHDGGAKTYPRKPTIKPGTAFADRWALDATHAATIYADYFHSQRDGWESSWPRDFCVRDTETGTVQRFEVDREHVPKFHAGCGVELKPGPHDHEKCPCGHPFGFQGPCRWRSRCTCGDQKPAATP